MMIVFLVIFALAIAFLGSAIIDPSNDVGFKAFSICMLLCAAMAFVVLCIG